MAPEPITVNDELAYPGIRNVNEISRKRHEANEAARARAEAKAAADRANPHPNPAQRSGRGV